MRLAPVTNNRIRTAAQGRECFSQRSRLKQAAGGAVQNGHIPRLSMRTRKRTTMTVMVAFQAGGGNSQLLRSCRARVTEEDSLLTAERGGCVLPSWP
jgi:hypothetical protein